MSPVTGSRPVMYTLPLSLFNELGRWSVESAGIDYEERRNATIFHTVTTTLKGAGTTPLLITDEQKVTNSVEIAEWADAMAPDGGHTYPTDPAERAEAKRLIAGWTGDFAMSSRRMAWEFFADDLGDAAKWWVDGAPAWQARMAPGLMKASKPVVKQKLGLSKEELAAAPGIVTAEFDQVAEMLSDGREFLGGDRFSILDIVFASMASPAICPPEGYPAPHFQPEDFPEVHANRIRGFREHPAGQFALRMYAEHRSPATRGSY
jgi:glutathione S-transferase